MVTQAGLLRKLIISLESADLQSNGNPNFVWNIGGVAVLSRKPAIALKRSRSFSSLIGSCIGPYALSIGTEINDFG